MQPNYFLLPIILFTLWGDVSVKGQSAVDLLHYNMNAVRNGEVINEHLNSISSEEHIDVVYPELLAYTRDTNMAVKRQAYRYVGVLAMNMYDGSVMRNIVMQLLNGCFAGSAVITQQNVDYLCRIPRNNYGLMAKEVVDSLVRYSPYARNDIYRLAGYARSKGAREALWEVWPEADDASEKWNIMLALARLNDSTAVERLLREVRPLAIDNHYVEVVLPGLLYTRNKQVYDHLLQQVLCDDCRCFTLHPDNEREVPCAYYLVEQLALTIEEFPLPTNDEGELRGWLTARSLNRVRAWIQQQPEYTINTRIF